MANEPELLVRCINDTARPYAIINPNGPFGDEIVAGHMSETEAKRFVRVVNSYDDLVKALRGAKVILDTLPWPDDLGPEVEKALSRRRSDLDAALRATQWADTP